MGGWGGGGGGGGGLMSDGSVIRQRLHHTAMAMAKKGTDRAQGRGVVGVEEGEMRITERPGRMKGK